MTEGWQRAGSGVAVRRRDPDRVQALRIRGGSARPAVAVNSAVGESPRILGLGPDEWLFVGSDVRSVFDPYEVGGATVHIADVDGAWARFRVSGPFAADLLSKGCTLDFHPRVFAVGACAQSALAQVYVVVDRPEEGAFDVYADVSVADHLELWFHDAIIEFLRGA